MKKNKTLIAVIILAAIFLFGSCSGCKNNNTDSTVVVPAYDEDSAALVALYEKNKQLSDSIDILKHQNALIQEQVNISKGTLAELTKKYKESVKNKDTQSIVSSCDSLNKEYELYVVQSDERDSVRGSIIQKQDSVINRNKRAISIYMSKNISLAQKNNELQKTNRLMNDTIKYTQKLLFTSDKKLRRNKWINSIAVPVAATVVTGAIAPKYTVYVGVGGVVYYLITKPKKKK